MSKLTFDWNVSVGNLISITVFVIGGFSAWYSLKQDIASTMQRTESLERQVEVQRLRDEGQDRAREAIARQFREDLRDTTSEIKTEIRDLRNELLARQLPGTLRR